MTLMSSVVGSRIVQKMKQSNLIFLNKILKTLYFLFFLIEIPHVS